jgi:hypothetical protein
MRGWTAVIYVDLERMQVCPTDVGMFVHILHGNVYAGAIHGQAMPIKKTPTPVDIKNTHNLCHITCVILINNHQ